MLHPGHAGIETAAADRTSRTAPAARTGTHPTDAGSIEMQVWSG